jgi:hypothetical protein
MFARRSKEKGRRKKMVDLNPMGDISLLECPNKNLGIVVRLGISEGITRNKRRRIRRKQMILMMSLKNILKRKVEIPLFHIWQPM